MTVSGQSNPVAYAYDNDNRLTGITQGTAGVSFTYDAGGLRASLTLPDGIVVSCGYDPASESTKLTYSLGGNVPRILTYAYDPDGRRIQMGRSRARTGMPNPTTSTSNFLSGALGSTLALADASGTVQTGYTYHPFGGTTVQGAANANSYEFNGRENDGDGLYYYRARYLSPGFARFVSEDPMGILTGSANPYTYVRNNPLGGDDPLGLWELGFAGGSEIGGLIKFRHNCGQWNFGLYAGGGAGFSATYDPTDSGYRNPGFYAGIAGTADVGIGPVHAGLDTEVDFNGSGSSSISIPFAGAASVTVPLPPKLGSPSESPHGTLGFGEGGGLGIGGTSYFGGNPSCGCGS